MRTCMMALICAMLAGVCAAQPPPWPSATGAAELLAAVPADLPGASVVGQPKAYTRTDVATIAGTLAENLFAYDYTWSVAAQYMLDGSGARAELHRFSTELDAFGAHSAVRDPKAPGQVIPLDRPTNVVAAFWAGDALHVWRGPFFARFVPELKGDAARGLVLRLAPVVLGKLPWVQETPRIFSIAPDRGMIIESVRFQRKDVLGQPSLRNGLRATYGRRLPGRIDVDMNLWLIDAQNPSGAAAAFSAAQAYLQQSAIPRPVGALGAQALVLRHPLHGQTYVMREGAYVAIVDQVKDAQAAEALLRTLGRNVRTAQ